MRILMILFPEAESANDESDPAVPLEWAAPSYYAFRDAGIEVLLASSEGGPTRMVEGGIFGPAAEVSRLKRDRSALDEFADTLRLDQAYVEDFDAAFCVGRPSAHCRSGEVKSSNSVVAEFLAAGKPVAITPSRGVVAPQGISEGHILVGDNHGPSTSIARALIGAVREAQTRGGMKQ